MNQTTNNQTKKRGTIKSILQAILYTIFALFIPTIAGVIITIKEIENDQMIYLIQFIAFAVGSILTLLLIKKHHFSFSNIGFQKTSIKGWMLALVLAEVIAIFNGFYASERFSLSFVGVLFLFVSSVGIFEELVFRGIILNLLKSLNNKAAVMISSVLFGVGHLANLLNGTDLKMTILQVIFAFIFGFVCAEIVIVTKSILIPIIWHASHDFIATLTDNPIFSQLSFIILLLQCLILASLAIYLWKKIIKE